MTPDVSLPTKQTVVFLNFICDFNATIYFFFFQLLTVVTQEKTFCKDATSFNCWFRPGTFAFFVASFFRGFKNKQRYYR